MRELEADALADRAIQVFGLFRDYGQQVDGRVGKQTRHPEDGEPVYFWSFLEPERYSTANRATARIELGEYLPVLRAGLDIQNVARVKHSFSANRQTETRQFLCNLDA